MFWLLTICLFVVAASFVVLPLWSANRSATQESKQLRKAANIALFHERNDELEAEFENDFLNSIQRKKLRMVREYASELRRQMFHWWVQAVDESGLKEEKISLKASIQKAVSNKAAFLARSNPRRERGETITAFRERVERFNENIDSSSIWLKDRGFTKKQIMNAFIEENRGKRLKRFTIGRLRMQLNRHIVNPLDPEDKAIRSILSQKSPPVEPKRLRSIRKAK